jgi:hypothetical protein|mmetsp:Transcript_123850/g.194265  ORF Transcript_123850/g.194265 Transcript_123850/m.194265 type:complete len:411 (+) Transcript_123850:73-1305(+)
MPRKIVRRVSSSAGRSSADSKGGRASFMSASSSEDLNEGSNGQDEDLARPQQNEVAVGNVGAPALGMKALEDYISSNFKELRQEISKDLQTILLEIRKGQVHSSPLEKDYIGVSPGQIKTVVPKPLSRQLFSDIPLDVGANMNNQYVPTSEVTQLIRSECSRALEVVNKRRSEMGGSVEEMVRIRAAMEALASTLKNFKDNFIQDVDVRNCREDMRKLKISIQKTIDDQTSEMDRQLAQVSQDMSLLQATVRDQVSLVGRHAQMISTRLDSTKDSSSVPALSPAFGHYSTDDELSQLQSSELSQLQEATQESVQRLTKLETTSRMLLDRVGVVFALGCEGGRSNTIPSILQSLAESERALHNHRLEMGRAMDSLRITIADNGKTLAETVQGQLRTLHQSFLDDLLVHLTR